MADKEPDGGLVSNWMHVDHFTVEQASALWCGIDPTRLQPMDEYNPSEYVAIKQMINSSIVIGEMRAETSSNPYAIIGSHSKSLVSRADLEAFAKRKGLFPDFLFNTLAPFRHQSASDRLRLWEPIEALKAIHQQPAPANKGGRPPSYDWDAFVMEIIRFANLPDGLPERQSDLVKAMLSWFQTTHKQEPAESAVKARISKIYAYLEKAKNHAV